MFSRGENDVMVSMCTLWQHEVMVQYLPISFHMCLVS